MFCINFESETLLLRAGVTYSMRSVNCDVSCHSDQPFIAFCTELNV